MFQVIWFIKALRITEYNHYTVTSEIEILIPNKSSIMHIRSNELTMSCSPVIPVIKYHVSLTSTFFYINREYYNEFLDCAIVIKHTTEIRWDLNKVILHFPHSATVTRLTFSSGITPLLHWPNQPMRIRQLFIFLLLRSVFNGKRETDVYFSLIFLYKPRFRVSKTLSRLYI